MYRDFKYVLYHGTIATIEKIDIRVLYGSFPQSGNRHDA